MSRPLILKVSVLATALVVSGCVLKKQHSAPRSFVVREPREGNERLALLWREGEGNLARVKRGYCAQPGHGDLKTALPSLQVCNVEVEDVEWSGFESAFEMLLAREDSEDTLSRKIAALDDRYKIESEGWEQLQQGIRDARSESTRKMLQMNADRMRVSFQRTEQRYQKERLDIVEEIETRRIKSSAKDRLATLMGPSLALAVHDMPSARGQAKWAYLGNLAWRAFEHATRHRAHAMVPANANGVALSEFLQENSLEIDLSGIDFFETGHLPPAPQAFVLFGSEKVSGFHVEKKASELVGNFVTRKVKERPDVVVENELSLEPNAPHCKMFITFPRDKEGRPIAREHRLEGIYVSEPVLTARASLIAFHHAGNRDSNDIAPTFFMDCGFATDSSFLRDREGKFKALQLSAGRAFSNSDDFTLGDFVKIFQTKALHLKVNP